MHLAWLWSGTDGGPTLQTGAQVKYEAAAAVGSTPASDDNQGQQFPHLYGPIDTAAVLKTLPMQRSDDGGFLGVAGLQDFLTHTSRT